MSDPGEQVLDRIDEAVLEPALWPRAVEALADLVGSGGGAILSRSHAVGIWARVAPDAKDQFYAQFYDNPIQDGMARLRAAAGRLPAVVTDAQLMPRSLFTRTPYFNEFMRPRGVGAAMVVELSTRDTSGAHNLTKDDTDGGFSLDDIRRMSRLQPQLSRSFWLSLQLGVRDRVAHSLLDAFDRCPNGVFVVDEGGRVSYANRAAEALARLGEAVAVTSGRLRAATPAQTSRLHGLIAGAASRTGKPGVGAMSIDTASRRRPLLVVVAPARADRVASLLSGRSAIVYLIDPDAAFTGPAHILSQLFGLSAAEARVALAIYEGATAREAARQLGSSFATVRSQLAQIYDKTQIHRQAVLVRVLTQVLGKATH